MNVKELNEKYQRIANWQSEYRKELISYINEAFAMHGNEFVLKPEDCETWKEAVKSDDFCACEDLPTWLMIWDRHEFSHEIYPTRIYRVSDSGMTYIDGYDNTEGEFVEGWYANDDNDDLSSIADFINAVLEQELLKVGTKCKWNDPAIDDYPEEDREGILNRVFTIEEINGEVILISDDEGTEAEVFACELELLY